MLAAQHIKTHRPCVILAARNINSHRQYDTHNTPRHELRMLRTRKNDTQHEMTRKTTRNMKCHGKILHDIFRIIGIFCIMYVGASGSCVSTSLRPYVILAAQDIKTHRPHDTHSTPRHELRSQHTHRPYVIPK